MCAKLHEEGTVEVVRTVRTLSVPVSRIEKLVRFVAERENARIDHIELAVVGKARMTRLNAELLGHEGPTDQISLDLGPGPTGGLTAQLIVCWDVAVAEARRLGHAPSAELLLYVTHGLLHVLGYDDQSPQQATRMHAREDDLLEAFGVGRVYGNEPR